MISVSRQDYIAVVSFLADRGVTAIFCCDEGVWLPQDEREAIKALEAAFGVTVTPSCPKGAAVDEALGYPDLQLAG